MPTLAEVTQLSRAAGPTEVTTLDQLATGTRLPCHTIVPAGLLERWLARGWMDAEGGLGPEARWWPGMACLIEDAWNYCAALPCTNALTAAWARTGMWLNRLASSAKPCPPAMLARRMLADAIETRVRSHAQGVEAGRTFLLADKGRALEHILGALTGCRHAASTVRHISLRPIKEGHVSSVVRVEAWVGEARPLVFALNLARDGDAAERRQAVVADDLGRWHDHTPDSVARVLGEGRGRFRWFGGTRSAAVLATEWINARELHLLDLSPEAPRFLAIDEFEHRPSLAPRPSGELQSPQATTQLFRSLAGVLSRLALDGRKSNIAPAVIEVNHGDLVQRADGSICLVASAGIGVREPATFWPYRLAVLGANSPRPIYWGAMESALAPCARTLSRGAWQDLRRAASALDPGHVARELAVRDARGRALIASARERLCEP